MKIQIIILSLIICCMMFFSSCATLPKRSALPAIPTYSSTPAQCKNPAKCGIMVPCKKKDAFANDWLPSLAAELKKHNIPVSIFTKNEYLTRTKRLSVERAIVITNVKHRILRGSDGSYTDVHIFLDVYNTGSNEIIKSFDVWGRMDGLKLVPEKIGQYAFKNLTANNDFMIALSKDNAVSDNSE